jgi:hypothetical protein
LQAQASRQLYVREVGPREDQFDDTGIDRHSNLRFVPSEVSCMGRIM